MVTGGSPLLLYPRKLVLALLELLGLTCPSLIHELGDNFGLLVRQ